MPGAGGRMNGAGNGGNGGGSGWGRAGGRQGRKEVDPGGISKCQDHISVIYLLPSTYLVLVKWLGGCTETNLGSRVLSQDKGIKVILHEETSGTVPQHRMQCMFHWWRS